MFHYIEQEPMCHVSQRFDIFPVRVQTAPVSASQFSKLSQILTTHDLSTS